MSADIRATGNQAPPLVDHNTVTSDRVLAEAVSRHASAAVLESLV
jgi:putative acyl-CoA dehydrogenase